MSAGVSLRRTPGASVVQPPFAASPVRSSPIGCGRSVVAGLLPGALLAVSVFARLHAHMHASPSPRPATATYGRGGDTLDILCRDEALIASHSSAPARSRTRIANNGAGPFTAAH